MGQRPPLATFDTKPIGIEMGPGSDNFESAPVLPGEEAYTLSETIGDTPDAPWIKIEFGSKTHLGQGAKLTITSLEDEFAQEITSEDIEIETSMSEEQEFSSAIFNGGVLEIELTIPTDDTETVLEIKNIVVGQPPGAIRESPPEEAAPLSTEESELIGEIVENEEAICGSIDNRVSYTDPRVGRLFPIGCTGWIISNNAFLTAGHCVGATMEWLQFNVPPSKANGVTVNPHPDNQYKVLSSSVIYKNENVGQDWAIFSVAPNSNTGKFPLEVQGAAFFLTKTLPTADQPVSVTGYGVDNMRDGDTGPSGFNEDNQTLQTHCGGFLREEARSPGVFSLQYRVDTKGGNSGSPITILVDRGIDTATAIGIHTNAGCSTDDQAVSSGNYGTSFNNQDLQDAINTFIARGENISWVDAAVPHPQVTITDNLIKIQREFWGANKHCTQ